MMGSMFLRLQPTICQRRRKPDSEIDEVDMHGSPPEVLRVLLAQFAEVDFPLLALDLQFGERFLDVVVVRLAIVLNDGSIGISARLEGCPLLGELSFLFVEFARPLHAKLLSLGFPIELQPP